MNGKRHLLALTVVFLAFAELGATCVDGVTPDCSDPKIVCGPGPLDATPPFDGSDSSSMLPDSTTQADTGSDAGGDARDAADADGG